MIPMRRECEVALLIVLLAITILPTLAHGGPTVRSAPMFSPNSIYTHVPGLVGNVWPGRVLAGSVGDLIFGLSASGPVSNVNPSTWGWDTLSILIPPEFPNILPEQVVSTLTNNYANIIVRTLSADDRYGPGWTIVSVTADANTHHQFINYDRN